MNTATHTRFDFRSPQRIAPSAVREVRQWLNDARENIVDSLKLSTRSEWTCELQELLTGDARKFLQELPNPGIGIAISNRGDRSLWTMSRPFALLLVELLTGSDVQTRPEERELSGLELNMVELAIQQLVLATCETCAGAPLFRIEETTRRPNRSRLFDLSDPVLRIVLKLSHAVGDEEIHWLFRQESLNDLCGRRVTSVAAAPAEEIVRIADGIPLQLAVELGRTELRMSEISRLQPGDVVVLDRNVHDELLANVEGRPKFNGRPGRIGQRRAFAVSSIRDDITHTK